MKDTIVSFLVYFVVIFVTLHFYGNWRQQRATEKCADKVVRANMDGFEDGKAFEKSKSAWDITEKEINGQKYIVYTSKAKVSEYEILNESAFQIDTEAEE